MIERPGGRPVITEARRHAEYKGEALLALLHPAEMWMRFGELPIEVGDAKLIDAATYEDGTAHAMWISAPGSDLRLDRKLHAARRVGMLSFAFVVNEVEPYASFAKRARKHYSSLLYDFPTEVVIAEQRELRFNMANMRNLSVALSSGTHVFMLDVDVFLTREEVLDVVRTYMQVGGVIHLKRNWRWGNGLYFGEKETFEEHPYDERFLRYFYEDTEFFSRLARRGVVPHILFREFETEKHDRTSTLKWMTDRSMNRELLKGILLGRR